MRSIRLTDAQFANNLIGKYGWSVGQSSNRRGLMVYRTEPKLRASASAPLHLDVHIRQIRSMLQMVNLNVQHTIEKHVHAESRIAERQLVREIREIASASKEFLVQRGTDRTTDRHAEQLADRLAERLIDKQAEQVQSEIEQRVERQVERHVEQLHMERHIQRQVERSVEQQVEHQVERHTEKQTQKQVERRIERHTEKYVQKQVEHQEQHTEKQVQKIVERQVEQRIEQLLEQQAAQPSGQRPEARPTVQEVSRPEAAPSLLPAQIRGRAVGHWLPAVRDRNLHSDYIEAFAPSSLTRSFVVHRELAITLQEVNHWIRNQAWRSRPATPRLGPPEYKALPALLFSHRKLPYLQETLVRRGTAVEQVRQRLAAITEPEKRRGDHPPVVSASSARRQPERNPQKIAMEAMPSHQSGSRASQIPRHPVHAMIQQLLPATAQSAILTSPSLWIHESFERAIQRSNRLVQHLSRSGNQQATETTLRDPLGNPILVRGRRETLPAPGQIHRENPAISIPSLPSQAVARESTSAEATVRRESSSVAARDSDPARIPDRARVNDSARTNDVAGISEPARTADIRNSAGMRSPDGFARQADLQEAEAAQAQIAVRILIRKDVHLTDRLLKHLEVRQRLERNPHPTQSLPIQRQSAIRQFPLLRAKRSTAEGSSAAARTDRIDRTRENADTPNPLATAAILSSIRPMAQPSQTEARSQVPVARTGLVAPMLTPQTAVPSPSAASLTSIANQPSPATAREQRQVQRARVSERAEEREASIAPALANPAVPSGGSRTRRVVLAPAAQDHPTGGGNALPRFARRQTINNQTMRNQTNQQTIASRKSSLAKTRVAQQQHLTPRIEAESQTANPNPITPELGAQAVSRMARLETRTGTNRMAQNRMTQNRVVTPRLPNVARSGAAMTNLPARLQTSLLAPAIEHASRPLAERTSEELVPGAANRGQTGNPALIVPSAPAARPTSGVPAAATRTAGNQPLVRLDVPVRESVQQTDHEPVLRSLEVAVKTIEQDLNQVKEEWAKPKIDANRLADQMYKEISKRMRQERQRRGI
ncbi:hypothetical protein [Cohnella sp. AR92]|uniref:hypothetical protein n=1 Tax=Cohnella sp. AR92 TaxID=648716 RepID=UPI000F8E638E|nr:hypothetical protein [Cohnella sp. AR92]RUS45902.1 hypothetical protein ELR57_15725 [Cohnella sp. AR92]